MGGGGSGMLNTPGCLFKENNASPVVHPEGWEQTW